MGAPKTTVNYTPLVKLACQIVSKEAGIVLGPKQSTMVETRVKKRMLDLKISDPMEYLQFIKRHFKDEKEMLVSALTTHHTYFFREFGQIQALLNLLPAMIQQAKKEGRHKLRFWSAACSRGHEVYTLAMFLKYHIHQLDPEMDFTILGTDIDHKSVAIAKNGVYNKNDLNKVPLQYLGDNWAKGKGKVEQFVRVKKELSRHCEFRTDNLVNIKTINEKFDFIFVRNVLIYFEEEDIKKITHSLVKYTHKEGYIICGVSESLTGYHNDLTRVAPYIYRLGPKPQPIKSDDQDLSVSADLNKPKRVVCVDDSKSVLKLLKRVLSHEKGFEVVGTAENGLEAQTVIEELNPDLVTLDIHMPEMTGLEYLQQCYSQDHPPVVVISSASREDSETAMKALKLGASDFIEKPSLMNLSQRGDEICSKLNVAFQNRDHRTKNVTFDESFSTQISITNPESMLHVIYGSMGRKKEILHLVQSLSEENIPQILVFEGQDPLIESFASQLKLESHKNFEVLTNFQKLNSSSIYLSSFEGFVTLMQEGPDEKNKVFSILGEGSSSAMKAIQSMKNSKIIMEDFGAGIENGNIHGANFFVPLTSFPYHIHQLFAEFEKK